MKKVEIEKEVEKEVREELKTILAEDALGYIHMFEKLKRQKLKERGFEVPNENKRRSGVLVD